MSKKRGRPKKKQRQKSIYRNTARALIRGNSDLTFTHREPAWIGTTNASMQTYLTNIRREIRQQRTAPARMRREIRRRPAKIEKRKRKEERRRLRKEHEQKKEFKRRKKEKRHRKKKRKKQIKKGVRKEYTFGRAKYDMLKYDSINNFSAYRIFANSNTIGELYAIVNNIMERENDIPYITLFFSNKMNNKIRAVTINSEHLDNLESFRNRIEEIRRGDVEGSGMIDDDEYNLITNRFDTTFVRTVRGFGKSQSIIFKGHGIESEAKECGYEALSKFVNDLPTDDKFIEKMSYLDKMMEYIVCHGLNISIVGNSFRFDDGFLTLARSKEKTWETIKKKKRRIFKLNIEDVTIPILYDSRKSGCKYIVYDYENKHFDALKSLEFDDIWCDNSKNIYKVNDKGKYVKITTSTRLYNKNCESKIALKSGNAVEYLFIDYETVVDWDNKNVMVPYSLSCYHTNEDDLKILDDLDIEHGKIKKEIEKKIHNNNRKFNYVKRQSLAKKACEESEELKKIKAEIDEIVKENCKFYLSFKCTDELVEYIEEIQRNKILFLVTFNGANFDNFILLNDILNSKNSDIISNIFYNGTQLLNFKLFGRHGLFDMRKHLVGSLKKNCKDFNISCVSKKEFDHRKSQKLYDNNNLMKHMKENIDEIKNYNNYDVVSLGVLYYRYKKAITEIEGFEVYGEKLHDHKTIGSMIFKRFNDWLRKKDIELWKMTESRADDEEKENDEQEWKKGAKATKEKKPVFFKYYKDMLKYKIAGRVECFNGVQFVDERCVSIDECSQYPYICTVNKGYFPCGQMIEIDSYEKLPKNKIGFFYCDIDQSELRGKNLPLIICEKTKTENKWGSTNKLKKYFISTVMIHMLKKYLTPGKLKIYNGIYFSERIKSTKMFGFLLPLMKLKNEQDNMKKDGNSDYNPSLRQTLKLLQNAISGKVIESLHVNKVKDVNPYEFEQLKNSEKVKKINCINIVGNKAFCKYEVDEITEFGKHRPIYLGILIYDYAKCYMYEHCFSKIGLDRLLYTDTDACKTRYTDFVKWRDNYGSKIKVPHWKEVEKYDRRYKNHKLYEKNTKVFGSFEDEFHESNNYNAIMAKKCYVSMTVDEHGEIKKEFNNKTETYDDIESHFSFKGIGKRDILLDLNEDFIIKKYYLKSTLKYYEINGILYDKKNNPVNNIDLTPYELIVKLRDEKEAYDYYNEDSTKKIKDQYKKLFDRLLQDRTAFILCQSISKSVNNMKRNVGVNDDDKFNKSMNNIILSYSIKRIRIKPNEEI